VATPTQNLSWTADFHLVDPVKLVQTRDITEATLVTVRARVKHTAAALSGNYHAISKCLLEMAHEQQQRDKLATNATTRDTLQFFYCARCGEQLTPRNCPRCESAFQPSIPELTAPLAPPVLPVKIALYAEEHGGRRFRHFVYRPRRP
jgi:uncharacterized C2H2 Zn-finger protein